jgi:hypothetical protein
MPSHKLLTALAALCLATSLPAQIFPGGSASDADRAIKDAEGKGGKPAPAPEKPEEPKKEPEKPADAAGPTEADNATLATHFDEAIKSIKKEQKDVDTAVRSLWERAHQESQEWVRGIIELNTDRAKEGGARLANIKPPISIDQNAPRERINALNRMRGGQALLDGYKGQAFAKFDLASKTEKDIKADAKAALTLCKSKANQMLALLPSDTWFTIGIQDRSKALTEWGATLETNWVACWNAWRVLQDKKHDPEAIWAFVKLSYNNDTQYLGMTERVLLQLLLKHFPKHASVTSGEVSIRLAHNYARTYQYEESKKTLGAATRLVIGNREGQRLLGEADEAIKADKRVAEIGILNSAKSDG